MTHYQLFISYCHKDIEYRQELEKWLMNLSDIGLIDEWHDGNLHGGDQLMEKISKKIEEADIILLLLSQDYLASKACKQEMDYALSKSEIKRVIPIVLKECTWLDTGCKKLLALPNDGKPIDQWEFREKAWNSVYEGIKIVINEMIYTFEIKEEFFHEIQKIEFVTQRKERPTLEEIFVFPNLKRDIGAFEKETISVEFFTEKHEKSILIRGRESSGKTALSRFLYLKLRENYQTILLEGNSIYKTIKFKHILKVNFLNN